MSNALYALQQSLEVTCGALRKLAELYPEDARLQQIVRKALNAK